MQWSNGQPLAVAGKAISQIRLYANRNSTPGQWDLYFQDLVYTAADGTVIPLFSQNPTAPSVSGIGSRGMTSTAANILGKRWNVKRARLVWRYAYSFLGVPHEPQVHRQVVWELSKEYRR